MISAKVVLEADAAADDALTVRFSQLTGKVIIDLTPQASIGLYAEEAVALGQALIDVATQSMCADRLTHQTEETL